MEDEYDIIKEINRVEKSVDVYMQVSIFKNILQTIQQYKANSLPQNVAEDILSSLTTVMALRNLRNKELTLLTIEYMECILKLRTSYIQSIIPYLYRLTDSDDESIKEVAYATFANTYIYVLLAAAKVMRKAESRDREMWECAEQMRKSLLKYYSRGGNLSLISLRFIHLLCHYFTSRDDRKLYSGKTGVVDTSIQFTINDIPESSPFFTKRNLVLDGYDYVNKIIQAFLTKASVFTFKHKIIAINSLFSIITHRKDFIPVILPLLLKYKPSNMSIQFVITSNMQRILKIPTFNEYEVTIVEYLTSAGIHEDAINRAREQRKRIGDYLKRDVNIVPEPLSPAYTHKYEGDDMLFQEEIENVMKKLGEDALMPLAVPSLDLKTMPLSVIKLFPISILASLALRNLQNEVQEEIKEEENEATTVSLKREADEENERKRRRMELSLKPSVELDIPARHQIIKQLIHPMIVASQNKSIVSQSYAILFDSVFSLLTISDENKILEMIEKLFGNSDEEPERHPFMEILIIIQESIPSNPSFLSMFLKRLYLRNKLYQQKCKKMGAGTGSAFYEKIYQSVVLHVLHTIYQQLDSQPQNASTFQEFVATFIQSIPVVPFEVFPFLLCNAMDRTHQEVINEFSVEMLQKLMEIRPVYTNECFACLLGFASSITKGPLPQTTYLEFLYKTLLSVFKTERLYVQFVNLVAGEEPTLQAIFQRLASFTNGIFILATDRDKDKMVQKSGKFNMVNTELQSQRKREAAILEGYAQPNFIFAFHAAIKVDLTVLPSFIQYITSIQSSVESSILQQLITQFCLPNLPTIQCCIEPISSEEMDGSQYALNQWKQDQTDYNALYSLVEMMVDCLAVNLELVIQILQQCLCVSRVERDEDLLALVNHMYEDTKDIRFKLLVMNWLEREEVVELLQVDPIPPSMVSWMSIIAQDPHPLTLSEILLSLFKHTLDKTMLNCLKLCARSEFYSIAIFVEALRFVVMENIDGQTLSYILVTILNNKVNVESQICECLIEYTKQGGFKNIEKRDAFVQFITLCKDASAMLLYVMSAEELAIIFKEVPDTKKWLLNYFQRESKTIPDYMTNLL